MHYYIDDAPIIVQVQVLSSKSNIWKIWILKTHIIFWSGPNYTYNFVYFCALDCPTQSAGSRAWSIAIIIRVTATLVIANKFIRIVFQVTIHLIHEFHFFSWLNAKKFYMNLYRFMIWTASTLYSFSHFLHSSLLFRAMKVACLQSLKIFELAILRWFAVYFYTFPFGGCKSFRANCTCGSHWIRISISVQAQMIVWRADYA